MLFVVVSQLEAAVPIVRASMAQHANNAQTQTRGNMFINSLEGLYSDLFAVSCLKCLCNLQGKDQERGEHQRQDSCVAARVIGRQYKQHV